MIFVRCPIFGRGWVVSTCGRYRIARMETHLGERFSAYAWLTRWSGLPELIDTFGSDREAIEACELTQRFSDFVGGERVTGDARQA